MDEVWVYLRGWGVVMFLAMVALNGYGQYTVDREEYKYRDYSYDSRDQYNLAIAGMASFVFVGLGQMYCDSF